MKSTASTNVTGKIAELALPLLVLLMSGCGLDPVSERRDRRPSDCPWLIGAPEKYPDLSHAERIDTAFCQTIDSNDTWIMARMKATYSVSELEQEIKRLGEGKYRDYRALAVKNLQPVPPISIGESAQKKIDYAQSVPTGEVIGTPSDWPGIRSIAPEWWSPPHDCPDGVVFLWDRQLTLEGPKTSDYATGFYVLYSPQKQTLWLWEWTAQHVTLSKSRADDKGRQLPDRNDKER